MNPDTATLPDVRGRILAAAEVVFAEKGYDAATVREITRAAGVNVAAVNYYFRDKERLYVECLTAAHDCADAGGEPFPEWPAGTTPLAKLRYFIHTMAARTHAPARLSAMRLLMREFADPSAAGREVILRYIQPKAHLLRGILHELLPGADPHRLLMITFSVIGQVLFYRQNRPVVGLIFGKDQVDALDAAAVAGHVTRFTLAALGFEPPYPAASPPEGSS